MFYFIAGVTGAVVPVIVEDLMRKDDDPRFYFTIRQDAKEPAFKNDLNP